MSIVRFDGPLGLALIVSATQSYNFSSKYKGLRFQ